MALFSDIALSRRPMAAFVVIGLAWGAFAGMVPPVKAQIGASDSLYGGLLLIASFGAIAAMWLAPVTQKVVGRWAIVIASLLVGIGFALVAQSAGLVTFVLAMLVVTMGTGVSDVLANAELVDLEAQSGRALMNLNHGIYSFSFAGGAVVTGILRGISWGPAEITTVLLVTVVALCLLMHAPKAAPATVNDEESSDAPLPALLVWLGGGVVLAAFLSEAATEGWSALHLERTLGAQAAFGALAPALFGLTMGIGRLSGHVLTGRIPDLVLMTGACLMAASGLVIAGLAPTLVVAYLGFACAGLGISVVVPLAFALIGRSVPEELRLTAIARSAAMGYSAFFLGPPIMGGIAEVFGLRMSFLFISALLVTVALVLLPALGRQVANKGVTETTKLIARLRRRAIDQAHGAGQGHFPPATKFPPLSDDALSNSLQRLGFEPPALYVEVLQKVGNGGFGPGYGLLGLIGGMPDDRGKNAVDLYLEFAESDPNDPTWVWPRGLLPICHWGCGIYTCIDCTKTGADMVTWDPNAWCDGEPPQVALTPLEMQFVQWLSSWEQGDDLWEIMNPTA